MDMRFVKIQHPWQYNPFAEPPLGFLSVAAVAREIPKTKIHFSDMALSHKSCDYKEFAKSIPKSDMYLFSAHTLEYKAVVEAAKEIKEIQPSSTIVAGGVHFDVFSEKYWKREIENTPFDIISVGEGEANIEEIIEASKIRNKQVIIQKGNFLNLDSLPMPARDLLNKESYFPSSLGGVGGTDQSSTVMASRGCPYSCKFCASPGLHNRTIRFRNLDLVKKEVEELRDKYGVTALRWHDDNFPLNIWSKKQKGLEDFLHDSKIRSRVSGRTSDICRRPEIVDTLWYAGVREMGIGIESADDYVLELMDKKTKVKEHEEALRLLKEGGFTRRIFLISGLPGETRDTGKVTVDFLEKTQPDVVTLMTFDPYPGSDTFNHPEKYGITYISQNWNLHNIGISRKKANPSDFPHELNSISREGMVENLEMIKKWVFDNNRSNVPIYNKPYPD